MPDFTERFRQYSNSDLLKIIDSPDDYEPSAVETAKTLLASHQLSDHAMAIAKAELAVLNQAKDAKDQKKKGLELSMKKVGASILSTVNPIQTQKPTLNPGFCVFWHAGQFKLLRSQ